VPAPNNPGSPPPQPSNWSLQPNRSPNRSAVIGSAISVGQQRNLANKQPRLAWSTHCEPSGLRYLPRPEDRVDDQYSSAGANTGPDARHIDGIRINDSDRRQRRFRFPRCFFAPSAIERIELLFRPDGISLMFSIKGRRRETNFPISVAGRVA